MSRLTAEINANKKIIKEYESCKGYASSAIKFLDAATPFLETANSSIATCFVVNESRADKGEISNFMDNVSSYVGTLNGIISEIDHQIERYKKIVADLEEQERQEAAAAAAKKKDSASTTSTKGGK